MSKKHIITALSLLAVGGFIATASVVVAGGLSQEIPTSLLVSGGTSNPGEGSPAGVVTYYNEKAGFGGIVSTEVGVEHKPLLIEASKITMVGDVKLANETQNASAQQAQLKINPTRTVRRNTLLGIGYAVNDDVAFLQAEDPGQYWKNIVINPSGGNVGVGTKLPASKFSVRGGDVFVEDINTGVIMKAPDGHCAKLTLANDNSLSVNTVACPVM